MKKIFILALCFLAFTAGVSYAIPVDYYIGGNFNYIQSIVNGVNTVEGGGSVNISKLNGVAVPYDYCVDLFTVVYVPNDYSKSVLTLDATIDGGKMLNNAGQVAWLLDNYAVKSINDINTQIALQAAIWNVTNTNNATGKTQYQLNTDYYTGTTVDTLYSEMLQDVAGKTGNISNYAWITPTDINGQVYQAQVTAAPVPEPGTMALLGFGMFVLAVYGKRRKYKA